MLDAARIAYLDVDDTIRATYGYACHLYTGHAATTSGTEAATSARVELEALLRASTAVPLPVPGTTDPATVRMLLRNAERDYERLIRDHLARAAATLAAVAGWG